jgi:8-hydroxy-5-deazaflavin:NADPH oxidoreductase
MRIAVIGTGNVGGALGTRWARAGYEVIFGTRAPKTDEVNQWLSCGAGKTTAATVESAVAQAEVIALAIPWTAVPEVLGQNGPALAGKVLIDCTNPSTSFPAVNHSGGSGGEQVAKLAPGAYVVKAFNTTGFENMENPNYGGEVATMFYAGDHTEAKKIVHDLARDLGFDPIDAGGLKQAQTLEMLASFWGSLAYGQKLGRGIAFRLLRRNL